jgi:hypothetical protein
VSPDAADAHAHAFTNLPLPQSLQHERENIFAAWSKTKHWHYTACFLKEKMQHFKSISRVQGFADICAIRVYGFNSDK